MPHRRQSFRHRLWYLLALSGWHRAGGNRLRFHGQPFSYPGRYSCGLRHDIYVHRLDTSDALSARSFGRLTLSVLPLAFQLRRVVRARLALSKDKKARGLNDAQAKSHRMAAEMTHNDLPNHTSFK